MSGRYYFVHKADTSDPYENLAFEDALISFVNKCSNRGNSVSGLYLWQSDNAIIVGRNQNIYKECALEAAREKGVKLVRRESGGGAVYQDLGNLNYSFISSKDISNRNENIECIISALSRAGVHVYVSGRNDLLVDGKKISGTAYRNAGRVFLQHGTLLISEDLELADRCLKPSPQKLDRKGVDSVRSRVMNLADIADISVFDAQNAIEKEFIQRNYGAGRIEISINNDDYQNSLSLLKSDSWIYRDGAVEKAGRVISGSWGTLSYCIDVEDGFIKNVQYETDAMDAEFWITFFSEMKGMKYDYSVLKQFQNQNCSVKTGQEQVMSGMFISSVIDDICSVTEGR